MKKPLLIIFFFMYFLIIYSSNYLVNADSNIGEYKILEMKNKEDMLLKKYKEEYGDNTYGTVAYILDKLRLYSIPLSFLGFGITLIFFFFFIRNMENLSKVLPLQVTFTCLLIICQILPLVFVLVMKVVLK